MSCPYCKAKNTINKGTTSLGYSKYKCQGCLRKFNERTNTPYNYLEYPTDIVLLVARWYLQYKLSLRDLSDMFLERGYEFSHESVRLWVNKFSPLMVKKCPILSINSINP